MLLANENTYRQLISFESVEEMNEAIKAHRSAHVLSDTERAILDVISQYACKFPGVCYLSKNKIGAAVGRVRRTVIRVCQRLEALGIIKQYETKRPTGDRRQSTNVIVIIPVVRKLHEQTVRYSGQSAEVTPDVSRPKAPITKQINNTYKDTLSADEIIKRGLKHAIPAPIYEALAPFLGGQELYDTYGILLRAKASIDRSITLEAHGQAYVDAFMNIVRLYKAGKVRKSFNGLLYSAWQSVTATIKRQIGAGRHPLFYDWLSYSE